MGMVSVTFSFELLDQLSFFNPPSRIDSTAAKVDLVTPINCS